MPDIDSYMDLAVDTGHERIVLFANIFLGSCSLELKVSEHIYSIFVPVWEMLNTSISIAFIEMSANQNKHIFVSTLSLSLRSIPMIDLDKKHLVSRLPASSSF